MVTSNQQRGKHINSEFRGIRTRCNALSFFFLDKRHCNLVLCAFVSMLCVSEDVRVMQNVAGRIVLQWEWLLASILNLNC